MRRLNSTKVSKAVRSTARREESEGGCSSTISSFFCQTGQDEKIPYRTGDVRLGLKGIVPKQDLRGGISIPRVLKANVT